jgi:signal transduction histidine kinase
MPACSETKQAASFPRGIIREVTALSLWGADKLVYQSIIALAMVALPLVWVASWVANGTLWGPQVAFSAVIVAIALACYALSHRGMQDTAAALLVGLLWCTTTIFSFGTGFGLHSSAIFLYLPCMLYTVLFFGVSIASLELALTIAALLLMYWAEQQGKIGGLRAFAEQSSNFNYLIGIIATSIGTLIVGVAYHRRVVNEAARVVTEAEHRRLAIEQTELAQVQLQTAHAKLQALNAELAERDTSLERELTRAKRDIDLMQDVVSKYFAASLRELRLALASPDDATEARLRREIGRMDGMVGALQELGRHSQPPLQRTPLAISALAQDAIRNLRGASDLSRVKFDVDANLHANGDRDLVSAVLRHLVKRAAGACKSDPHPLVHVGGGSRDGQAVIFVRDNGPGMDEAQREKLFTPFEQGQAQDNTIDIGFVSARRIAERHGGDLTVESAPGQGTTYFFSLPAA